MGGRDRWLTPDAVAGDFLCRRLFIPAGTDWLAIVTGALNELIYPYNFEEYGSSSPDDTAAAFRVMFDKFCFDEGCRLIGEIVTFAGSSSPAANFLACDGASLLRADYPDLFTVIGTTYGAIDSAHFNVPDLRGRIQVGEGPGPGLTPRTLGDEFGEETHVLTVAELASHSHIDSGHSHTEGSTVPTAITIGPGAPAPSAIGAVSVTGSGSASLSSAGSDDGHNNMQPGLVLSFWIVAL